MCRDGYHMGFIYGRYLLSATWYEFIFNKNIMDNNYIPKTDFTIDEVIDSYILNIIKEYVHNYLS